MVQINGKKRSLIQTQENLNEKVLLSKIKEDKLISKYLVNKTIKRSIYIKNKIINIIIW